MWFVWEPTCARDLELPLSPVASDHSHVDFKKTICDCHQGSHKSTKEVYLRSMVT